MRKLSAVGLGQKPRTQLSGFNLHFVPQEITTTTAMCCQFFTYSVSVIQYGFAISIDLCKNKFPFLSQTVVLKHELCTLMKA